MPKDKSLGLYVHIPFCARKCAYCDFYSVPDPSDTSPYVKALKAQIRRDARYGRGKLVDTVYFGGGTPSLLPEGEIASVLKTVRETFEVAEDAEITLEANPGTLDIGKLSSYRSAGVNRLSIGLQSADDEELKRLSRIHTRAQFEQAFLMARMEGFSNISADIMYGLPGQTLEKLNESVTYLLALDPEHISFYGLKIEENTPFGQDPSLAATLPDEDAQVEMYIHTASRLDLSGFKQYEISNFAKPGFESRHNLRYWRGKDYLGFGPAAWSFVNGRLFSYRRDLPAYLNATTDEELLDEDLHPTPKELATQYVMMAMRTSLGVPVDEYAARFKADFEKEYLERMKPFLEKRLIIREDGAYRLSRSGMLVSNYILSEILDFGK